MKEIIEFIAVFFATIFQHLRAAYAEIKHPELRKIYSDYENLINNWVSALVCLGVVGLIVVSKPQGFDAIGINANDKTLNFAGMVKGFIFMSGLLILTYFYRRWVMGKKQPNEILINGTPRPEVREIIGFEHGIDRFVYLSVMTLRVVGEEFVYRGYLILLLGNRSGSMWFWVLISILLSTLAHLYQERKIGNIVLLVLFSAAMGLFVVVTQNLFASITAHLFNNLAFILNTWKQSDREIFSNGQKESSTEQMALKMVFGLLNFGIFISFLVWAIDIRFWIK